MLALTSFLMMGSYYCYDNPAALYKNLESRFWYEDKFDYYFDLLYSVYSLPNIVLPMAGGMLVDRAGVCFSLSLFAALILLGQVVVAAGCQASSLQLMLLGRAIFGLGGESISVAQSAMITQWFAERELALALGVSLSVSRFGSVINNVVSPRIVLSPGHSVTDALWVGALTCVFSLGCALAMAFIDARATRAITAASRNQGDVLEQGAPNSAAGEPPRLRDATRFSAPFWLLAVSCVVVYGTVLPFNNVASALLQERDFFKFGTTWRGSHNSTFVFGPHATHPPHTRCSASPDSPFCHALFEAERRAGLVMSVPYVISAICTPIMGLIVDRYGGRANLVVVAPATLLAVHLSLALTSLPAASLLIGLGLGYMVFASVIWPSIPSVVAPRHVGTAYGLVTAMQNMGLFAIPIAVGMVHDLTADDTPDNPYRGVELFFAALALVGVGAGLLLNAQPGARTALNTPGGVMAGLRDGSWTPSPPSMSVGRRGSGLRFTPSPDLTCLRE